MSEGYSSAQIARMSRDKNKKENTKKITSKLKNLNYPFSLLNLDAEEYCFIKGYN